MPLESASWINELVTSNPAIGDSVGRGDDHMRLLKQVLKNCFPNVGGAVTLSHAEINALPQDIVDAITEISEELVPTGLIAMWSGSNAAIPDGWALCDGSNGTPDLRDRFVVGSGSTYATGNTGGTNSGTTSPSGSHSPTVTLTESTATVSKVAGGQGIDATNVEAVTGVTGTVSTAVDHTHTVTVLPKYYALAYIMKVAA